MKKISTAHLILISVIIVQNVLSVILTAGNISLPIAVALIISQLTILLPFALYCIAKKQNPFKLIRFKKISIPTAILSAVIAICAYPVVVCLNLISMLFVENAMTDVMTQALSMGVFAGVLLMAVSPAIIEETIFRGVIYNTYSKRRPLAGIFLSALLFGLMHMNFNQMLYAFFLGIILALLMEACDSIIAPMIFHFTLNAGSTLMSFVSMSSVGEMETSTATNFKDLFIESYMSSAEQMGMQITEAEISSMYPMIIAIVVVMFVIIALAALAAVLALIYAVFRMNNRKPSDVFKADHSDTAYIENKNGAMKKNRMVDLPAVVFIIYALVRCIINAVA